MKYLKTFNEATKIDFHLAKEIAEDLLPQLVKKQNSGELITTEYFHKFLKEKGLDISSSDLIINELINMDFNFDDEDEEEEIGPGDWVNFDKHGLLYVITFLGDGILVSKDEEERYKGDNGDGFIIPLDSKGTIMEKG